MLKTKILVTSAALALATASFAVAQTRQTIPSRTQVTTPTKHSSNPKFDVYVNWHYVGSDPDVHIRMQLQNDPTHGGTDAGSGSSE